MQIYKRVKGHPLALSVPTRGLPINSTSNIKATQLLKEQQKNNKPQINKPESEDSTVFGHV